MEAWRLACSRLINESWLGWSAAWHLELLYSIFSPLVLSEGVDGGKGHVFALWAKLLACVGALLSSCM